MDKDLEIAHMKDSWAKDQRWKGIRRNYTPGR
jgi:isocitrate lyase